MRNGIIGVSLAIAGLVVPLGASADADDPVTTPILERAAYVSSDSSRCVSAPGGSAGDVAVVNITNTGATGGGYGSVRASGTTAVFDRPGAQQFSSVNFAANTPANPNLAVVTIGSDGQFCYDGAVSDHHVILDLAAIIPASNISAIDPTRILDTRGGARLGADSSRCVSAPGGSAGDVAVVNITNTGATGGGYGSVRASGTTAVFDRPGAQQFSSVNFAANTPANPNLAVVTIGSDGQFCYDGAVSDHHVILDLAAIIPASNISAIDPTRILDTRGGARLGADSSRCVSAPGGSAGDVAVVNITNTGATGGGYGSVRASGTTAVFDRPGAQQFSSVNFAANTPANPNLAVVTIGSDGQFCYDGAVSDHHVILDLAAIIPASNISAIDPTRILDTRGEADPPPPCDPSYPSICVPPPPPQLSCADVGVRDFPVQGADPHNFDADGNGVGCESPPPTNPPNTQPPTTQPPTTQPPPDPRAGCSPSYPDVCIAPGPPDLNCGDIPFKDIRVVAPDEHNLDGNNDGIGCLS